MNKIKKIYLCLIIILISIIYIEHYNKNDEQILENDIVILDKNSVLESFVSLLNTIDLKNLNYIKGYKFILKENENITLKLNGTINIYNREYKTENIEVFKNNEYLQTIDFPTILELDNIKIFEGDFDFDGYVDFGLKNIYYRWNNEKNIFEQAFKFDNLFKNDNIYLDYENKLIIKEEDGNNKFKYIYDNFKLKNVEISSNTSNYNLNVKSNNKEIDDMYNLNSMVINIDYNNLGKDFNLKLYVSKEPVTKYDALASFMMDYFTLNKMEVFINNKLIQTILFEEEFKRINIKKLNYFAEDKPIFNNITYPISLQDINFDGDLDFSVINSTLNYIEHKLTHCVYLWDSKENKFKYFDTMGSISVEENQIISSYDYANGIDLIKYYKWGEKQNLMLIKEDYIDYLHYYEGNFKCTIEYLKGNKFVNHIKFYEPSEDEDTILFYIKMYGILKEDNYIIDKVDIIKNDKIVQSIFLKDLTKGEPFIIEKFVDSIVFQDTEGGYLKIDKNFDDFTIIEKSNNYKINFKFNEKENKYEINYTKN